MKVKKFLVAVPWFAVFCMAFSVLWKGGKTIESVMAFTWILTGGLAFLWAYLHRTQKSVSFSWVKLGFPLLFGLSTWGSWLVSDTKNVGLNEVWMSMGMLSLYWLLVYRPALAPLQNFETKFFRSAPALFLIAFLIGLSVYITEPVNRFVGTFFDYRFHTDFWPNAWGQFILVFWPMMALGFMGLLQKWPRKIFAFVSVVLVLGALALSYSRGATLAFAGQMILLASAYGWSLRQKKWSFIQKDLVQKGAMAVLALACAWGVFAGVNALREPFQPVQSVVEKVKFEAQEGKSSINERAQFWRQSWKMFLEKPLWGYGPYSFPYVQADRMEGVLASSDHAHNIFLKFASERGLGSALAFVLWLALLAGQSLRVFLYKKKSHDYWQAVFLWIACAGVIAHNMMDYNLQFIGIVAPFMLAMGLLAREIPDQEAMPRFQVGKKSFYAGLFFILLFLVHLSFEAVMQAFIQRSRVYSYGENHPIALQWMQRGQWTLFPKDLFLRMAENYEFQGEWEKALASTLRYGDSNSHDFSYWKRRAFYEKKLGQKEASNASITEAMNKGDLQDAQIFRLYLEGEKETGLVLRRTDLIPLFDAYVQAILENAHFIALSRTPEEIVKIADLLAEKYPRVAENVRAKAQEAMDHAELERSRLKGRSF